VDLHLRFYDFCNKKRIVEERIEGFELYAGLISALNEFSKLLGFKLELLKFKDINLEREQIDKSRIRVINPYHSVEIPFGSDVIFSCENERFLNICALQAKMNIIYDLIIKNKIPLGPEKKISRVEEEFIQKILDNYHAKENLNKSIQNLEIKINELVSEYKIYGLIGISILSFDACILKVYNFDEQTLLELLRDVGKLPELEPYSWEVDIAKYKNKKYFLYLINSGIGIKVEKIFMPYYYLLICDIDSYLGEIPQIIYKELNFILDQNI